MSQAPLITPELLHLIAQLDEAKGQWQALKSLAPERLLALRHSAAIESIGSSTRIEGVKLSNHEVERLLASLNQTSFATRDEQEVAGYAYVPYSSLESVIEANKEAYYLALRQTQTTLKESEPAWHPWLLFFLKALTTQKDRLLSRLDAEHEALATLTPLARSISELLASQARVSVASIVAATGVSRNTVKATLTRMLQTGLLVRHGSGRAVYYTKR
jgi:Fic family protein